MGRAFRGPENRYLTRPPSPSTALSSSSPCHLTVSLSTATVGISRYAAKALGDVVYVELPALDAEVGANETIGAVESVKAASDINSPISGTVVDVNNKLEEEPKLLNDDPEGEAGWIAKLDVQGEDMENEMADLMDAKAYSDFTEKAGSEE